VPWAFKEMAATRVQAHEVAAVLQWHIRNDFISRGALLLVGMVAAAALVARGAARGGAAGRAHLAAGALVLAAAGLCIARCPPWLPRSADRRHSACRIGACTGIVRRQVRCVGAC